MPNGIAPLCRPPSSTVARSRKLVNDAVVDTPMWWLSPTDKPTTQASRVANCTQAIAEPLTGLFTRAISGTISFGVGVPTTRSTVP